MSGGVDSSVAALLLHLSGHEVFGLTMRQIPAHLETETLAARREKSVGDAKRVARCIGIEHEELDFSQLFEREVVNPFLSAYRSGLTPNPCFRCNPRVKFRRALEIADKREARWVASGHYARILLTQQGPRLAAATDPSKDQSYFLAGVPLNILTRVRFPNGDFSKDQIRSIARRHGLPVADKEESQEICFTVDGDVHGFLAGQLKSQDGEIVDEGGNVLGTHKGIIHYTVGQRRGLGLAGGPYYVKRLDARTNRVVIGRHEELFALDVRAIEANYLAPINEGTAGKAKIRSRHCAAPCTVINVTGNSFTVRFNEPQWGVAPGQALVVYDGEYVVAGGIIESWVQPT